MSGLRSGKTVYSFATPHDRSAERLYINVVKKYACPNLCRFCSRIDAVKGLPNIYEEKAGTSLYLKKAPTVEEVVREVEKAKKPGTKEIAFVGLGEPLTQFDLVCKTMRALRDGGYKGSIRIDTDGLVKCMRRGAETNAARELKKAGLTDIWISVNATNAFEYERLCRPRFKSAFEKLCEFVRDCRSEGIRTFASFVVGFDDGEVATRSEHDYRRFAKTLGLRRNNVVIRKYVPPIAKSRQQTP